eukprot:scaffold61917_cov59-Phaeocystis_antarctica.AAC.6
MGGRARKTSVKFKAGAAPRAPRGSASGSRSPGPTPGPHAEPSNSARWHDVTAARRRPGSKPLKCKDTNNQSEQ